MKNKRLFSILLVMLMIITSFLSSSGLALAAEMEGDGTEQSPYLIKTPKDLYDIKDNITAYYKLANDLDFENIQRQPIDVFNGTLDGDGHIIKNVNIAGTDKVGLFGTLTNVTIKNLGIEYVTVVSSGGTTGVLFGQSSGSTFKNCYVKNINVSGTTNIGGFGGYASSASKFDNCCSLGGEIASSGGSVGGIVGYLQESDMKQCYSNVTIETKKGASGGLIGHLYTNNKVIECSYNGKIKGAGDVGGIGGLIDTSYASGRYVSSSTVISNSFANGSITTTSGYAGGLIGNKGDGSYVITLSVSNSYSAMEINATNKSGISLSSNTENTKNSYFDGTILGKDTPIAEVRTTEQLYSKSNYVDWDFENIWTIEEGKGYPTLQFAQNIDTSTPGESGTTNTNFKIVLEIDDELQLSLNNQLIVNEEATWTSSNEKILTVDNKGVVKALAEGTVTVTASHYEEDYTEKINIFVVPDATYLRLAVDLKVGENALATVDDLKYTKAVTWSSDNPEVATASKRGKIVARGKGLALVKTIGEEGKEIGKVYVRVR